MVLVRRTTTESRPWDLGGWGSSACGASHSSRSRRGWVRGIQVHRGVHRGTVRRLVGRWRWRADQGHDRGPRGCCCCDVVRRRDRDGIIPPAMGDDSADPREDLRKDRRGGLPWDQHGDQSSDPIADRNGYADRTTGTTTREDLSDRNSSDPNECNADRKEALTPCCYPCYFP